MITETVGYEPPLVEVGSPMSFEETWLTEGVQGYAVANGEEIWIPLISGEGTGKVGKFIDSLTPRCCFVNVGNPRLVGMLSRRGWTPKPDENGVDIWRKQ